MPDLSLCVSLCGVDFEVVVVVVGVFFPLASVLSVLINHFCALRVSIFVFRGSRIRMIFLSEDHTRLFLKEREREGGGGGEEREGGGREREKERERERERQTDRQTDREGQRQTERQTER